MSLSDASRANPTVVVAGGGASGTLFAAELAARHERIAIVVVEPRERLGIGVAYSTDCPWHLLNVPASKMSARADDPHHFVRWLRDRFEARFHQGSFVPRGIYGDYLHSIAARAAASSAGRLRHARTTVVTVAPSADRVLVTLATGERIAANALVLALGNEPRVPAQLFDDAWGAGAMRARDPAENVLLIGSGLTAVDAVLGLRYNGHRGIVHMISRRGLVPLAHRPQPEQEPRLHPGRFVALPTHVRAMRTAASVAQRASGDWRPAVDRVRASTNVVWSALDVAAQRRFLVHALPYWNVHRHRMAPEVAERLAAWIAAGDVRPLAARIGSVTRAGDGELTITVRPRGGGRLLSLRVARAIACAGSETDVRRSRNPLLLGMVRCGLLTPAPAGVGACVAGDGALIGAGGLSSTIFAIGPLRFGTLLETTAIPEIREQACRLAARIAFVNCA